MKKTKETKKINDLQELWAYILTNIKSFPLGNVDHRFEITYRYLSNYDGEILCRTKEDAGCIADFFKGFGFDKMHIEEIEPDTHFPLAVYPD